MKKIVPCLDIKDGRLVKGKQFVDLEDKGEPVDFAKRYVEEGADEIVFLDITRSQDGHQAMLDLIGQVKAVMGEVPLIVGGGIASTEDAREVLEAGADRVSVASAAVRRPDLINEISQEWGSEALTIAVDVDVDPEDQNYYVYTQGGQVKEDIQALDWIQEAEKRGAGSLLITSIPADGSQAGFDLDFLKQAAQSVSIPITASGGAGSIEDFERLFLETGVVAGLAASIFHNGQVDIRELKASLRGKGVSC